MEIKSPFDPSGFHSRKVAVAMSGGVDSSVAAALLVKAGFDVAGFTMIHLDNLIKIDENAPYDSSVKSAEKVAAELGIKHFVIDLSSEFSKHCNRLFLQNLSRRKDSQSLCCL